MYKLLLLCMAILQPFADKAQQQTVDSLNRELALHREPDTNRLNILLELASSNMGIDPARGILLANQAVELAERLKKEEKLAEAFNTRGKNFWASGNDADAEASYLLALRSYESSGNIFGAAKIFNNVGLIQFNRGNYVSALENHRKALEMFRACNSSAGIANSYNNVGVVYQYLGNYPAALDHYMEALKGLESIGDSNSTSIANAYTNIGIIYKYMKMYPKSLEYAARAINIYERQGNLQGLANVKGNIGTVYDEMQDHQQAIAHFSQALVINRQVGNRRRIASDLTNLAIAHAKLDEFAPALENLSEAKAIYEEIQDENPLSIVLNQLGQVYLRAPQSVLPKSIEGKNKTQYAIELQEQALALSKKLQAPERQVEIMQSLSTSYESVGQFEKALHLHKQATLIKDTLLTNEKKSDILRREAAFEYEVKEAKISAQMNSQAQLLDAERSANRTFVAGAAILLVSMAATAYLFKRKRLAELQQRASDLKAQVAETEMKALRVQMNPHFIFNSLNSINAYIDKGKISTATVYVTKFSRLMRMILENSEKQDVLLSDDLRALELYMQLESMRTDNAFEFQIDIDTSIDPDTTLLPPLILQPFVENSIWHGLNGKVSGGKILIKILKKDNELLCIVEDNGKGRLDDSASKSGKKSLGLSITQSRLDLINRIKNARAQYSLTDLEQGLRVEVKLPFESAY